jgi:hypothetical protein
MRLDGKDKSVRKKSLKKETDKNKRRNRESGSGPAITRKEDEASNKGS